MHNFDDFEDDYEDSIDPIQEIRQREIDKEILADAFSNSEEGPRLYELENMINYYVEIEEYERCIKLRSIMHDKFPDSILTE